MSENLETAVLIIPPFEVQRFTAPLRSADRSWYSVSRRASVRASS